MIAEVLSYGRTEDCTAANVGEYLICSNLRQSTVPNLAVCVKVDIASHCKQGKSKMNRCTKFYTTIGWHDMTCRVGAGCSALFPR